MLPLRNLTHYTLCYIQKNPTIHASNTTLFMLLAWLVPISSGLSTEFYFFALLVQLVILESLTILKVLPSRLIAE